MRLLLAITLILSSSPALARGNPFVAAFQCAGASVAVGVLFALDTLPIGSIISSAIMDDAPPRKYQDPIFTLADAAGGATTFFAEAVVYNESIRHTGGIPVPSSLRLFELTKFPYRSSMKAYYEVFKSEFAPCNL